MTMGEYVIDEDAYAINLVREKMIQPGQKRGDLEALDLNFNYHFIKMILLSMRRMERSLGERFLSRTMPKVKNYIETKPIDRAKYEKQKLVGLSKTKMIRKYRMDILGNYYMCSRENFFKILLIIVGIRICVVVYMTEN